MAARVRAGPKRALSRASAVADVGEDADAEWGVYGQDLFSVDAKLAPASADWPVNAIVVAARQDLRDIGRLVRLIPRRQPLAERQDRARRQVGMDRHRDLDASERIVVPAHHARGGELVRR